MKKPGCVLFLACFLCCRYVLSNEGAPTRSDEVEAVPVNNITEVSSNDEIAAISDDQHTISNISDLTGLESKNNDSVDNTNGAFPGENISSELPPTERSGSRRLKSSRYKNGRQQVSINDLTLSENVPRHGALVHKTLTKFDKESAQNSENGNTNADTLAGLDASDNSFKRKRRIPTSSATPSVQIVILVIGGVLLCVLLTGFIRWRVRGRINAAKQKENQDNYEDSNCEMDTIYECECEEGRIMLNAKESDLFEEEDGSKFSEIACSHRFDAPLSLMSQTYSVGHNARLVRPKSPKSGRDLGIIRGSKRHSAYVCRQKYGNKGRYSRHQRKRLENMFVQKLETIPMENIVPPPEDIRGISYAASIVEHADKNGNKETASVQQPLLRPQQPTLLPRQSTPAQQKGVLTSLLNTWRSLSFNRDWVGKMWQEQHNIRRISDVFRGLSSKKSSDSEHSSRESLTSDSDSSMDMDRRVGRFSTTAEVELSGQEPHPPGSQDTVHNINETEMDIDLVTAEEATSNVEGQSGHSFSVSANITSASVGTEVNDGNLSSPHSNARFPATDCSEVSQTGNFPNNWSFADLHEEPPEYESLLASAAHSRSTPLRISNEIPRYQRRHSRNWLDERHRTNRYFPTSVRCAADLSHTDSHPVFTLNLDEPAPFPQIHIHNNQPMNCEYDESNTVSMTTSTYQTETILADEETAGASPYINSSNTASASPVVAPFVPQEGVVIEQLSDGAQIVYIPPPALPSYHNDTPPPYRQ